MSPSAAAVIEGVNQRRADALSFGFSQEVSDIPIARRKRPETDTESRGQQFDSVLSQETPEAPIMSRPRVVFGAAEERFRALQQFEGTVLEIQDTEFVARTRDLTDSHFSDEQVALPLEDVPPGDIELLKVGAIFYWMIGYEENNEGSRKRTSLLRFRRLPAWSARAMERIRAAADDLKREFGVR